MRPPITEARVLYRPTDPRLGFLPEGPYPCGPDRISWVSIQYGPAELTGALNVLDLVSRANTTFELDGRPGFAFATTALNTFIVGLERRLGLLELSDGHWTELQSGVDAHVTGTIINDGVVFDEGLVFGAKDTSFREKKAGLYLWREADRQLIRLRDDQICSNGKVITRVGAGRYALWDIDSPAKTVVQYELDVPAGTLSEPQIVVDLRSEEIFPDGMVATPDGQSVIVAIYNPSDALFGEARQYGLARGNLEAVWHTPGSPQVTCPLLVSVRGKVQLVLTTASENMSDEKRRRYPDAGCLFVADTPFASAPLAPRLAISSARERPAGPACTAPPHAG